MNPRDRDSPDRRLQVQGGGAGEMIKAIEDLLSMSGGDGDFIKGSIQTTPDLIEIDQILEAWSEERGRSIECLLVLGRVRRLLSRILAAGRLTDHSEGEVKSLLRLIDSIGRDGPGLDG
jgi:hypothetical protein